MSLAYDAVLLIAFGGPTSPEEVRPFLARVLSGMAVPPERVEEVVHHYEAVGGTSPLKEITFRQAEALQKLFQERSLHLPVYVGMRNTSPFFVETLKRMADDGIEKTLAFILSPHQTEASWERYKKNIADARAELGLPAPEVDYCGGWHNHALFIETWVELVRACLANIDLEQQTTTPLIFTAHSVPTAMASSSPYVEQVRTTARLIAARLDHQRWSIAYQSRSGRPTDSWLEPDIKQVIRDLAAQGVSTFIAAPIGFVCDHVEVLYDLDIEAKKIAADLGMKMLRASCPNDHPTFIHMTADVIEATLSAKSLAHV